MSVTPFYALRESTMRWGILGRNCFRLAAAAVALAAGLAGQQTPPPALKAEDCAGCHDSGPRAGKRQPGVPPGFNAAALKASPHAALDCVACHSDIKEVPHPEKLAPRGLRPLPQRRAGASTAASVHGKKAAQNDPYAPSCKLCHGTHDILPPSNLKSPVATINVPRALRRLPPRRHAEVSKTRAIPQTNILGELQGQHSRHRPVPAGPDRDRGLHQLPHRAQRASAHRSRAPPSPNRTSPRPARGATRRSRPCIAR